MHAQDDSKVLRALAHASETRMTDSRSPRIDDGALAAVIAAQLAKAKSDLYAQMMMAGFTTERGWRISEQLRHLSEGTVWTFRPIHSREPQPDLEVSVAIDHEGRLIEP